MEDALGSISDDLAKVFEETIARIDLLPEDQCHLAKRTLAWLVHAKADLTSMELGDALSVSESIKMGYTSWSTRYRPVPKMMINCCQGLAIIAPATERLSLAHYTVQEYFEKHADRLFPGAREDIATTCLSYLLYEDFESGPCSADDEVYRRVTQYPFVRYAASHWGKHVAETEKSYAVAQLLSRFLQQRTSTAAAYQVRGYVQLYKYDYWAPDECMSVTPLHIASRCGLKATLEGLLQTDCIKNINLGTARVKSTPVILAASGADSETLSLLLGSGANPFIRNGYGDALDCACEAGESQNVRLLVQFGMIPNTYPEEERRPAILCTMDHDRLDTFQTLVELAADPVNPRTNSVSVSDPDLLQFLFIHAVEFGAYGIVNWLLGNKRKFHRLEWLMRSHYHYPPDIDYQFNLDSATMGGPALHLAILNEDIEMVRLLVSWGANTHARDAGGITALTYAAESGISALADIVGSDLQDLDTDSEQTSNRR